MMRNIFLLLLSASIAACRGHLSRGRYSQLLTALRGSFLEEPSTEHVKYYKHVHKGTFQQNLDHNNVSLGTFSQTYWWDSQWYGGPGYPIIVFAPSEENGTDFIGLITELSTAGELAKRVQGATILMEHRYWGHSSPCSKLTTKNMQYLTLENAIADCTNFAQNVVLPFAAPNGSRPDAAPWVLIGGSYSGALTAWVAAKAPGTFWAYLATSAVVQTVSDFWQYFAPIQAAMPKNCSADVTRVIDHMDNVLEGGDAKAIHRLKQMFGLEKLEHNDDFMSVLANGPYRWQEGGFLRNHEFYQWCNYVENFAHGAKGMPPGPEGVGLEKALAGYAEWIKKVWLPGWGSCKHTYGYTNDNTDVSCFNTYNASNPVFTDTSLGNTANRQWMWFLCNQPFGYWQVGAPRGTPTIVSRLFNVDYVTRQCGLFFPPGPNGETYGLAKGMTVDDVNAYTGGWFIDNTTRLIYINGEFDPWRDTTVSSLDRPGGPLVSTPDVPVLLIPDGVHCSDLASLKYTTGPAYAGLRAVQEQELSQLQEWVSQFPATTAR